MLKFNYAITLLACLFSQAVANAADLAAGKLKAEQACAVCHAKEGNWSVTLDPSYPKLAGQHKDYLIQALHQYKDGRRKNAIMAGQAAALNKQEIDNLAAFLATLPGELSLTK